MNYEIRNIVIGIHTVVFPQNQVIDSHQAWFFYVEYKCVSAAV